MTSCPCGSGSSYLGCCGKYHRGEEAPDPLTLMRSRYAAYAKGRADYIIRTTHPHHKDATTPIPTRRKSILAFCKNTRFDRLEILEVEGNTVTFRAHLTQEGRDISYTEKSLFELLEGKWYYLSGDAA